MSSEQLRLLLKDTTDHLFRLRIQSQTEKLDTPSELKKNRLLIARIQRRAASAGTEGRCSGAGWRSKSGRDPRAATEGSANRGGSALQVKS